MIELDVFVVGEDILWDGLRNSYRVKSAPLRPVFDVYPAKVSDDELQAFHLCSALCLHCFLFTILS